MMYQRLFNLRKRNRFLGYLVLSVILLKIGLHFYSNQHHQHEIHSVNYFEKHLQFAAKTVDDCSSKGIKSTSQNCIHAEKALNIHAKKTMGIA